MKTKPVLTLLTLLQLHFAAASRACGSYVAHEWGTFTSVQGADGVQIEWNPLLTSELPKFVYDRHRLAAARGGRIYFPGKDGLATLQRLETPVIYFYSGQEQSVNVAVNFPQGIVTEWYPRLSRSQAGKAAQVFPGPRTLRWENVRVLPLKPNDDLARFLPIDKSGSHYYTARQTDSAFLRVGDDPKSSDQTELEKFLFYRGVGSFRAPLTVTQSAGAASIALQNTGLEELRHLFLYTVREGQGKVVTVDRLAPGENRSVSLETGRNLLPLAALREDISRRLRQALVEEGLYEREASAMVATWDDSWFAEQGVRVLYTLPRAWTDRILPLTLEPKPRELVRVMVGRAELITPAMEWELLKQVVRFADGDETDRVQAVDEARKLGLGRFLEPTTRRLAAKLPTREFSKVSWDLLQAASKSRTGGL